MKEKYCEGCKKMHPVTDFNKLTAGADGRSPYCRAYTNKQQKIRNEKLKSEKDFMRMFSPI